jgi:hypothetical protein
MSRHDPKSPAPSAGETPMKLNPYDLEAVHRKMFASGSTGACPGKQGPLPREGCIHCRPDRVCVYHRESEPSGDEPAAGLPSISGHSVLTPETESVIRYRVGRMNCRAREAADGLSCREKYEAGGWCDVCLLTGLLDALSNQVEDVLQYLKDGETPGECIERHRKDIDALLMVYRRALAQSLCASSCAYCVKIGRGSATCPCECHDNPPQDQPAPLVSPGERPTPEGEEIARLRREWEACSEREAAQRPAMDDLLSRNRELQAENAEQGQEIQRLKAALEYEQLRLAACTAAALGNTPEAVAQRIKRGDYAWSASYGDVCKAVDREMALRADVARLTNELRQVKNTSAGRLERLLTKANEARDEWSRAENAQARADQLAQGVEQMRTWLTVESDHYAALASTATASYPESVDMWRQIARYIGKRDACREALAQLNTLCPQETT